MSSILAGLEGVTNNFLLGYAIGRAAGPALEPIVQDLANLAWSEHAVKPPPASTLALGLAQGQVDADKASQWASETGFGPEQFQALVDIANTGPELGLAYSAWRRGRLTDAQFRTALKRTGLEDAWYPALVALKENPLEPAQIATAVHRNIMRDPSLIVREPPTTAGKVPQVPESSLDPANEAEWSGIDHERLRVLVGITGLPPGLVQMLQLLNRGEVTEDDVRRSVAQSNLRNEYMDVVLALARQLLTATEYVDAHLRGYITEAEMYAGTALHGMTQADTDILFKSHGRPLTVHQIVTGEARGGTYDGPIGGIKPEILAALRESSIKPPFYNLANANRYTLPSAFVMRALTQSGVWTLDKAHTRLLEAGWIPEDALEAATAWAGGPAATADPHVAKAQTQLWTTLHRSYLAGESTEAEVASALPRAGVSAGAVAGVLATWDEERTIVRKQLSPAQVKKAYTEAVLNPDTGTAWTKDEATAALVARGYSTADATTFLEL